MELNYRAADWCHRELESGLAWQIYTCGMRSEVLKAEVEVKLFPYSWETEGGNFVFDAVGCAVFSDIPTGTQPSI